jgi:uncharacterized protein
MSFSYIGQMHAYSKTRQYAILISIVALICAGCSRSLKDTAPDYAKFRADRAADLSRPDGLISIALAQGLKDGDNTIGSAPDNVVVYEHLPPHLGTLHSDNKVVTLSSDTPGLSINGKPFKTGAQLPLIDAYEVHVSDEAHWLHYGELRLAGVVRNGDMWLMIKDPRTLGLMRFSGLNWYPAQPKWRIAAHYVPYTTPHPITIVMSKGQVETTPAAGYAEFTVDGRKQTLVAIDESGELFFVIGDLTNKTETYGGGRFLETAVADHGMDHEGTVMLDFNQLVNPQCAYAHFKVCPRPPRENELNFEIPAGEKRFDD